MPDKPRAEFLIDEDLVRRLWEAQATEVEASPRSVVHATDGWDCSIWRVGETWAVRLPRRALAAPLVLNEQRVLPLIAARLEPTGIHVPSPVIHGTPVAGYPWPWSVVAWIDGTRGIDVPRAERSGWAGSLSAALGALHVPAPDEYPLNPFRGVPLATRAEAVAQRLAHVRAEADLTHGEMDAAASVWAEGLAAPRWAGPPVWMHGDLHPANLVAQGRRLVGIIDFGDVTAGDPAYDLAIAWLAFDESGRREFVAATASRYDEATWVRARAWAVAVALMLLVHSDDEPAYAALGREAIAEVM